VARRTPAVLDAPSNLGLSPPAPGREPGCRRAPAVLRSHGLVDALGALDAGIVDAPAYAPERDDTGHRSGRRIAAYSSVLADRVGALIGDGAWPLVLGGDCSIMLGNVLALRRRGRVGLLYLDGHVDFRHPGISDAVGAVAGEGLALATGRGHPALTDVEGRGPLVAEADAVALGNSEWDEESVTVCDTDVTVVDRSEIGRRGADVVAGAALEHLRRRAVDAAWLHVDVDILDGSVMPAVDSPNEDGLDWDELTALVAPLAADPLVAGMELTIYDPDLDPDGHLAERLVSWLAGVLR
jgi:arginase